VCFALSIFLAGILNFISFYCFKFRGEFGLGNGSNLDPLILFCTSLKLKIETSFSFSWLIKDPGLSIAFSADQYDLAMDPD
jgi:hypothetical protein